MTYRIEYVEGTATAGVYVVDAPLDGTEVHLDDDVRASIDRRGALLSLDLGDTTMFGVPFDQAAAARAVAWARDQLQLGTAS